MKQNELSNQEKEDLIKKLSRENSIKLADNAFKYFDTINKIYAKYEFTTEFHSDLSLYMKEIVSRNFKKFNEMDSYTKILLKFNLTPAEIERYLDKLKADAVTQIINKVHFEKKVII